MSIFSKKNKFSEENEFYDALFSRDEGDTDNRLEKPPITSWEEKEKNIKAPHALTAEELNSHPQKSKSLEFSGSLFEKILKDADKREEEKSTPHIPSHRITAEDITANRITAESIMQKATEKKVYKPKDTAVKPDGASVTPPVAPAKEDKQAAEKTAKSPAQKPEEIPMRPQPQAAEQTPETGKRSTVTPVREVKKEPVKKPQPIAMSPQSEHKTVSGNAASTDSDLTGLLQKCMSFIGETDNDDTAETVKTVSRSAQNVGSHINYTAKTDTADRVSNTVSETIRAENESADSQKQPDRKKKIPVKLKIMNPSAEESIIKTDAQGVADGANIGKIAPITEALAGAAEKAEKNERAEKSKTTQTVQKNIGDTAVFDAVAEDSKAVFSDIAADKESGIQNLGGGLNSAENTDRTMVFDSLNDKFADSVELNPKIDKEDEFIDDDELDLQDDFDEFEESGIPEYNSINDTAEIKVYLRNEKKRSLFKIFSTAAAALIAFVLSVPAVAAALGLTVSALKIANVILIAAAILINLKSSIALFAHKSFSASSLVSAAVLVSALVSVVSVAVNVSSIYLSAAAATVLLFNEIGNFVRLNAVSEGLDRITSSDKKKAVNVISNREKARSIVGNSIDGEVLVGATQKTVNITGFMKSSFSPSPFDKKALVIFAAAVVAAAVSAVIVGISTGNSLLALSVFGLALCLANAPSFLLTAYLPLSCFSKTISEQCGGMLGGYDSIELLSQCNAAAVDATDLFPKGTLILSKLHILGMNEIDKTLINAAALSTAAESPIGGMLKKLIGDDVSVFPTAEDVKYEKGMGISGWFKEEHMLIGNRDLMIAHDIALPPMSVDTKILKAGFFPVYIASGNKVCALLITKYIPNERVAFDLRGACELGVTVCVRSTDPNITAKMLSNYFGVYDDSIEIMSKEGAKTFEENEKFTESVSALASFRGSSHALLKIINAACKIKNLVSAFGVIGAIIAAVSLVLTVYLVSNPLYQVITAGITAAASALMFIISKIVVATRKSLK